MLDACGVQDLIEENFLGQGMEHVVGVLPQHARVIKDYDTFLFNEDTGEMAFKPTDSLFDYLTDHLLANRVFGDDLLLEGFYSVDENLHIVLSQPFILGHHKTQNLLISSLEERGLKHEKNTQFSVDGGDAGPLRVTDMHEDNVIFDKAGNAFVIDVHFRFSSRTDRIAALKVLGLYD